MCISINRLLKSSDKKKAGKYNKSLINDIACD